MGIGAGIGGGIGGGHCIGGAQLICAAWGGGGGGREEPSLIGGSKPVERNYITVKES
jgi:hypothetical protein